MVPELHTPAGHWDAIAAEDFITKNYSEVRWARNMALLNMSLMDAAIVCWDTKYFYFNPGQRRWIRRIKTLRVFQIFRHISPGIQHSAAPQQLYLAHIVPEKAAVYKAMAQEASVSRMFAGIHYRSDCEVGLQVGNNIGNYAIQRAKTDGAGE